MVTTREQGEATEKLAAQYLKEQGLKLLDKNFHSRFGELDLVMLDNENLVFVEVRYRRSNNFGSGAETITASKQSKLMKTASVYLQQHAKMNKYPARFDVVSISGSVETGKLEFNWIENAFGA
jgi:putative endonuclease